MITDFYDQLHYIPQAIIMTILFSLVYLYIHEHKRETINRIKELLHSNIWMILFLFYSALLFTGTVMARYSTYPFTNIIGIIGLAQDGKINIGGLENVLIFIPYTILFVKAFAPKKVIQKCFVLTVATTGFIEAFQLLFWLGQFSVADLIHNILGGMLGCFLWCITHAIVCWNKKRT